MPQKLLPTRRRPRLLYIWSSLALATGLVVLTTASFAGATLGAEARLPINSSRLATGNVRCCRGGAVIVVGCIDRASVRRDHWHTACFRNHGQNLYPAIDTGGGYFGFAL